jgi:hypothetical protein
MKRAPVRRLLAATVLAAGAALAGCGEEEPASAPSQLETPTQGDDLLAEHDLAGMDARQVIKQLDRAEPEQKPNDLFASVRPDELVLQDPSTPGQQQSLPIEDDFYLAVAPYVRSTHDCFHHSLTTCQGELVEEDVQVTITDSEGEVLVDGSVTTYPNGFAGFWLPRDIDATLEVRYEGRRAEVPISTGPEDPTCLTTVKLT